MKAVLFVLVALAALPALAADQAADQAAIPPAPAASAAESPCVRVTTRLVVVNGKQVEVHKRERVPGCHPPAAVKLWD